jgi:glycosyltransferase involved in cell wall biosynthesis
MPIKSVHITNYYHKNSGGISTSYNSLLDAATRHKRHISLIVPGKKEETEVLSDYARIYYVPASKSPVFDKRYRVMMPWQYIPNESIIRRILLKEMPQMIEIRDKYTLSIFGAVVRRNKFKQLNRPMLVSFSSERMDDNLASFVAGGKISRWFARRIMGNYNFPSFDFHITNSDYTVQEFYQSVLQKDNPNRSKWFFNFCWRFFRGARVPVEDRIHICPSGVDAEQFSPDRKSPEVRRQMIEKAGIPENSIILLYAGRISPEKNVKLLPEFMEILARETQNDFRLLVAGAGPQAGWLQQETDKRIPGKIIQLGHLDKETLANFYATADVFVHPNPKEPFGIAPLEAMASGVPTVVPNAGGLLFYATEENTWLVEPTAENFAKAIKEIINDPEIRGRKIEKAFQAVQSNTRIRSTDFLIETYDKLYEDFQKRNELFTDAEASKSFNFLNLVNQ